MKNEKNKERVDFVEEIEENWVRMKRKKKDERRVELIIENYKKRDGRIGNGVGIDKKEGKVEVLREMEEEGYRVGKINEDRDEIMREMMDGKKNEEREGREIREKI